MNSINDLYRQVIVEHYKNPRNKGLKEGAEYRSLRLKNPSCGDDVTIQIKTNDNIVEEVKEDTSGHPFVSIHADDYTTIVYFNKNQRETFLKI